MVDKHRRRDVIRGLGAAGMLGLAGCGDSGGNGNGNGGRTIRMGILMGVTGGLEDLGPPIRDAAELVPQQVEDADTAFSVDVQFEDTATQPSSGVSGANALVNAGYPMICGALSSEVTLQVAQNVAIPSSVTMCSPASTSPEITTLNDNDFVYRTPPTDALQGSVLADIAANRLDAGSAATLYLNNAYGTGLASGFEDSFESDHDGTITASVSFQEEQSSYTSQLQQVLADDPDTMLVVGYPASGQIIFRDFYSSFDRADMPVLVADGLQSSSLPGQVGFDMSNVTGTAPTGEGPGLDFFTDLYSETYDADPNESPFTKQSYDAAAVLVLANAAAGENDGTSVRDNMRAVAQDGGEEVTPGNLVEGIEMAASGTDINYQGVSGPIAFDDNGDLASASYQYFGYTSDGSIENLDTITP